MNFAFILVSACLVTLASANFQEYKKQRDIFAAACKNEINATDEDYAILTTRQQPKNEPQSCLLECIYKKFGLVKDGKLDEEEHRKISKAIYGDNKEQLSLMEEIYKKCSEEVKKTSGETCNAGKTLRSCVVNHFPQASKILRPKIPPS